MTDRSATSDTPARAVERLIWQEADQIQPEAVAVEKILADPAAAGRKVGLAPETVVAVIRSRPSFLRWRQRREARAHEVEVAEAIGEPVEVARRRFATNSRAVISLPYLSALIVIVAGYALTVIGHTQPYPLAPLAAVGPFVIGAGVGIGAVAGGLAANPYVVLALVFGVGFFLFGVGYYNIGGLQSWGL